MPRSESPSPRYHKRNRSKGRDGDRDRDRADGKRHHRRSRSQERTCHRSHTHSERDAKRQRSVSPYGAHTKRRRSEDREPMPATVPDVGSIVRGKVHTIKPFGLFVTLEGYRRQGLVHQSQVSEEVNFSQEDEDADKVAALEYFFPVAAQVRVKILEVQSDERGQSRISCSIRAVDQETGQDLDPENKLMSRKGGGAGFSKQGNLQAGPPELNSIHRAEVATIKPFGVFVRLEGYRTNGMVHVSQVSDHMDMDKEDSDEAKVAAIGQVLARGEVIWVKVVEIKDAEPGSDRGPKVSCSLKLVSQRDGTDLDPHGLKFRPKPVDGEFGQRKAVGADVGAIHQGQIDWGHLNAEKVNLDPTAAGYEILGAEVEDVLPNQPAVPQLAPGSLPPPPTKGLKKQQKKQQNQGINSVEEALAVLKAHKAKSKKKKEKKEKKAKKNKKEKKRRDSSASS